MNAAHALVGDDIPAVCLVEDVCRHLRMSRRTFFRLMGAGQLPVVELERFGRVRRFTGDSVKALTRSRFARRPA